MQTARRLRGLAAALAVAAPALAHAELVIVDWQTPGDQALMWDTTSNREWLRLEQTGGLSANEVWARTDLRGFTFASVLDVQQLFDNAGLQPRDPAPDAEAKFLIGSWGLGGADGDPGYVTLRALTNTCLRQCGSSSQVQAVAMVGYGGLEPGFPSWADAAATGLAADQARADTGAALWRLHADPVSQVPEPASLLLAATGLLALLGARRRAADH